MEIHYSMQGGWSRKSNLDIYGTGRVVAYYPSWIDSIEADSVVIDLSDGDQKQIAAKFKSFSKFEPYYSAGFRTDQNIHEIIFIYDGVADTVAVYDPPRSAAPDGLISIIDEMEQLRSSLLD